MNDSKNWQDWARCRNEDPNTMQPEVASTEQVAEALAVCNGCPVLEQCRQSAQAQKDPYGIWAGAWWGDKPKAPAVEACTTCGDATVLGRQLCARHVSEAEKERHLRLLDENSQKQCTWAECTELRHAMKTQVSPYCREHKAERERLKRQEKRGAAEAGNLCANLSA